MTIFCQTRLFLRSCVFGLLLSSGFLNFANAKEMVITFGGDVNFNENALYKRFQFHPRRAMKYGQLYPFSKVTAGVRHLIDGDVNFANIETVVTDGMTNERNRRARQRLNLSPVVNWVKLKVIGREYTKMVGRAFANPKKVQMLFDKKILFSKKWHRIHQSLTQEWLNWWKKRGAYLEPIPLESEKEDFAKKFSGRKAVYNLKVKYVSFEKLTPALIKYWGKKMFGFLTHTNAIRHMVKDLGFNLFSLANNHTYDFDWGGMSETYWEMVRLQREFRQPITFAGVGTKEELVRPQIMVEPRTGLRIAFNAMSLTESIYTSPVSVLRDEYRNRIGMLSFRRKKDREKVLKGLREAKRSGAADFSILSLHEGWERYVGLDQYKRVHRKEKNLATVVRESVHQGDVDLLLGHHPHVVRPIERDAQGRVAFYSLGNFMMLGAANIDKHGTDKRLRRLYPGCLESGFCRKGVRDYGLHGRAYVYKRKGHKARIVAVEYSALKSMHLFPKVMSPEDTQLRMKLLNILSREQLGEKSSVQFKYSATTNSAVACFGGPYGVRASQLCGRDGYSKRKSQGLFFNNDIDILGDMEFWN